MSLFINLLDIPYNSLRTGTAEGKHFMFFHMKVSLFLIYVQINLQPWGVRLEMKVRDA